jgi:hypothetical protein
LEFYSPLAPGQPRVHLGEHGKHNRQPTTYASPLGKCGIGLNTEKGGAEAIGGSSNGSKFMVAERWVTIRRCGSTFRWTRLHHCIIYGKEVCFNFLFNQLHNHNYLHHLNSITARSGHKNSNVFYQNSSLPHNFNSSFNYKVKF